MATDHSIHAPSLHEQAPYPAKPVQDSSPNITVVSACNERYFPGLLTALFSLLTNLSHGWTIHFHILTDALPPSCEEILRHVLTRTGKPFTLRVIVAGLEAFQSFGKDWGGSHLTYARLLIPDFISSRHVLYVDSDMVIQRDVSELTSLPWPDTGLLYAVTDQKVPTFSVEGMRCERVGVDPSTPYFNAGFLWIDLDQWRREKISQRCLAFMERFPDELRWWDQSALNVILHDRRLILDAAWNIPADWTLPKMTLFPFSWSKSVNPHYVGPDKPWLMMNPYRHFYRDYARRIAAELPPGQFRSPSNTPGAVLRRWRFFFNRAFWHYGSFCKQRLRRLLR